jgi:hypothetical protein
MPHVCGVSFNVFMFVLTLVDDLRCAWFINPICCWCWCLDIGPSFIDWPQLSRLHLKTEIESSFRNVVYFK